MIAFGQNARTTISLTAKEVTTASYTDKEIVIDGQTDLHLTAITKPLNNSIVKLNSENSWVFFDNIRPSFAIDSLLKYIYINDQPAALKTNVRVSIYKHGTVIIPQASTYQPLTVYAEQNFSGSAQKYSLFTFNNALGSYDNKIRSFKLKRGYMATLATAADGTGYSRVYIADKEDLEIPVMPDLLDRKVSFIRVLEWEYVSKKGWAGSSFNQYNLVNATWRYDWSAGGSTTPYVEYVPIRQNGGWPGWSEISGKTYVSHVLGFNEPDHTEQSNLTVSQALAQWPEMMKTGLRIGSPACTSTAWIYAFMDSCKAKNYRVDYVAWHAYWGGKSPSSWYNDLKAIHQRTGRPIWITEWNNGANWTSEYWPTSDHSLSVANAAKQLSDLKNILQVLDTASFIERYSIYNWVQDCRAMVLADTLTPAGKYYAADNAPMAFNRSKEVIPTFAYGNPTATISFGPKKLSIGVTDPNGENFCGFIVEKKMDNGNFEEFYNTDITSPKTCTDTIDINAASKTRYRLRSKLPNGLLSAYSNEVGYDVTNGTDIQYGNLSFGNVGWNPVFFKQPFSNSSDRPVIIFGSPTNNNFSVLMSNRVNLVSNSTRFIFQFSPWAYQGVSSLSKDESISYFIANSGTYDFGGLKAIAARASNIGYAWTTVTFSTPFDTIPVVFTTQLYATPANVTTVRVKNVTKTGFQVRLQKESKVTTTFPSETISYLAITPGKGTFNNNQITVGKTANNAVGTTTYTTINYGDSVANAIFLPQMQTCNDDTVTATLRCTAIGVKSANVKKQRELSLLYTAAATETVGWMLIKPVSQPLDVSVPTMNELKFYPNPARDYIYLNQNISENLSVEIYNMFGVLVKRIVSVDNKIDVRDIPSGCYVLRASRYGSTKFIKL